MNKMQWSRHWRIFSLVGALIVLVLLNCRLRRGRRHGNAHASARPGNQCPVHAGANNGPRCDNGPINAGAYAGSRNGYRRTGANSRSHATGHRKAHTYRYAYGSRRPSAGFVQAYSGHAAPSAPGHYDVADLPKWYRPHKGHL